MFYAILLTALAFLGIYFFLAIGLGGGLYLIGSNLTRYGWWKAILGVVWIFGIFIAEVHLLASAVEAWVEALS